ncbi:hypothetical protein FGB62_41g27 [Gracilaria domingensis]|nr:hypothetical protein FGB62_41g27 [Gracilaria domingensis]
MADLLSSQASVRLRARRYRPIRHRVDRLLNVLGKHVKNDPLLPKSTTSESDTTEISPSISECICGITGKACGPSKDWADISRMHPSRHKLLSDAASKKKGLLRPDILPPISEILDLFEVRDHHKAGLKSDETTHQGQSKRKLFMFAPRDDSIRGNGFTDPINGSHQDQTSSVSKGGEQQSKSTDKAPVQKGASK